MAEILPSPHREVSAAQIRAARAFIGWSQVQLAEASGVPVRTLIRLEAEEGAAIQRTRERIVATLEGQGVVFTHNGVLVTMMRKGQP